MHSIPRSQPDCASYHKGVCYFKVSRGTRSCYGVPGPADSTLDRVYAGRQTADDLFEMIHVVQPGVDRHIQQVAGPCAGCTPARSHCWSVSGSAARQLAAFRVHCQRLAQVGRRVVVP